MGQFGLWIFEAIALKDSGKGKIFPMGHAVSSIPGHPVCVEEEVAQDGNICDFPGTAVCPTA